MFISLLNWKTYNSTKEFKNKLPHTHETLQNVNSSGTHLFNEQHLLDELKHYFPTQTPLKDFIHHNSLHAFQHMKFYDAIFKASAIFGYQVTLELADFRKMYEEGRIRKEILDRVISTNTIDEDHKRL